MNFSLYNWWKDIDKFLFFLIILLISLGIFFSLVSTSLIASTKLETTSYYFFFKQFFYTLLGIFTIFFFSLLEEKTFYKLSLACFIIIFCTLILVPIFGVEVKGSKRWIDIFFFPRFQPIEILKPFLIIILSMLLTSDKYYNKYVRYLFSLIVIIPIILLLFLQPDIGQTLLVLCLWLSLIFVSGINLIFLILFILIGLCTLLLMINFIP
jgi:Bacterial cell division membrane protein